jgi:hypothetical protein
MSLLLQMLISFQFFPVVISEYRRLSSPPTLGSLHSHLASGPLVQLKQLRMAVTSSAFLNVTDIRLASQQHVAVLPNMLL